MNPDPNLEIVTVFESDDLLAFQLAKSALDEAGIEYTTAEDALPGFGFGPMVTQLHRIMIPAYRVNEAVHLLEGGGQDSYENPARGS